MPVIPNLGIVTNGFGDWYGVYDKSTGDLVEESGSFGNALDLALRKLGLDFEVIETPEEYWEHFAFKCSPKWRDAWRWEVTEIDDDSHG